MGRKNNQGSAGKYLIAVLSALCIVLIVISIADPAVTGGARSVTSIVVNPMQRGISSFGQWIGSMTSNLSESSSLRAENEDLKQQVNTLMAENSQLVLDKEELSRLRELVDLSDTYSEYETIGAHVISKDSGNWFSNFTIDRGSSDGIAVNCNVIGGSGLVGIVTAVGPNWASVRSIIDDDSNVSAMISTTSDTCIIAGNLELIDSGTISLVKLTDEDNKVHVGDKVVTSNISEKFLPGILIGYISELNNDANNLTKSGQITPVVDFAHLQEVLVIKQQKQYVVSSDGDTKTFVNDIDVPKGDSQTGSTEAGE